MSRPSGVTASVKPQMAATLGSVLCLLLGVLGVLQAKTRAPSLRGVVARWTQWDGVNLTHSDLRGATILESRFPRACLERADLSDANLQGCDFARANLRGARLVGSDLRRCFLGGADLSSCDLRGARLEGANLDTARLASAQLAGATYNQDTTFPEGFDPEGAGLQETSSLLPEGDRNGLPWALPEHPRRQATRGAANR